MIERREREEEIKKEKLMRDIEREGEIERDERDRRVEGIERVKVSQF
jgi:hypothetical protein